MSPTTSLLIIFVAFLAIGVMASVFMGRRGHNPFAWLLLGVVLGPLVIPVIVVAVYEEKTRQGQEDRPRNGGGRDRRRARGDRRLT